MFEMIIAFAVGIIILCLIAKIISLPVKLLWKFITNSLIGAVMLWVVNLFGAGIQGGQQPEGLKQQQSGGEADPQPLRKGWPGT